MTGYVVVIIMFLGFLAMIRSQPEIRKDLSWAGFVRGTSILIITAFGLNYIFALFPGLEWLVLWVWMPVALIALVLSFVFGPMIHRRVQAQQIKKATEAWAAQMRCQ